MKYATTQSLKLFAMVALAVVTVCVSATHGVYAAAIVACGGSALLASPQYSPGLCFNTLTSLMPDFYKAMDVVSKELVGFIPAVQRDATADRCALNATMRSFVAPASTASDVTPAMAIPAAAYQTIGNKTFSITKARFVPFSWTGDEEQQMDMGPGVLNIQQDQIAQALRALINEMESDIGTAVAAGGSRAFGTTAGTAPVLADYVGAAQILDDNGAPQSDRHVVINTSAAAALRNTSNLFKVNESGDGGSLLRQGMLGNLYGFDFRQSAQVKAPTKGTAAASTSDNAGYAVGATTITLAAAGTGTILAGDIITFNGDANKYIVATGNADVSAGGTIVLAAPGLRQAMSADTKAITVFGTSSRNAAFTRNAVLFGTRLCALPKRGDMAKEREVIVEPRTGIAFDLAYYPGFHMGTFHVAAAWGAAVMKAEHLCHIIG